jgi:hypothetical protein
MTIEEPEALPETVASGFSFGNRLFDRFIDSPPPTGQSAMIYRDDINLTTGPKQTLTFGPGGDGTQGYALTDGVFKIIGNANLINIPGPIFVRPNGIDATLGIIGVRARTTLTASGDGQQVFESTQSGIRIGGGNGAAVGTMDESWDFLIDLRKGKARNFHNTRHFSQDEGGSLGPWTAFAGGWPDTTTDVVLLELRADQPGAFLNGTRITLFEIQMGAL